MKKSGLLFFVAASFCIVHVSCKRSDYLQGRSGMDEASAKVYLEAAKNLNPGFVDTLMQSAQWRRLTSENINATEYAVYIPVPYNNNTTGLVFIMSTNTKKVEEGYFLEIKSTSMKPAPQLIIARFYGYKNTGFTGSLTRFDFDNHFKWEMGYVNGINIYQRQIRHSNYPPASLHFSASDAGNISAWVTVQNPVTTYYMITSSPDGSEDWEYLFGPCSSKCQLSLQITRGTRNIATNCSGNGSMEEVKPIYKNKP